MRIVEFLASRPAGIPTRRFEMKIRRIGLVTLPVAAAAVIGLTALPSLAASPHGSSLDDGAVHTFTGCLTQESGGVRYFDLKNAKTEDGKSVGTIRLTSDLPGITNPEQSLNREVRVIGDYRGHSSADPVGGHVVVKDAGVTAGQCS
jgi:hypothetical protein